ncbi:hypothetical protein [Nocardia sp. NPDC057227]|uniref:hypothetical protein n=1 Tax=Nocardia sp. NPDC057227 TaxID=3346056 RepID=UPI00363D452F
MADQRAIQWTGQPEFNVELWEWSRGQMMLARVEPGEPPAAVLHDGPRNEYRTAELGDWIAERADGYAITPMPA